jgi:hypothetical protein
MLLRNSGRHIERLIVLGLAPATLINAIAQRFRGAPMLHIPCLITLVTGHRCPGCGLTRALTLLWCGEWRTATALNPLSPIVFSVLVVLFCLQVRSVLLSQREIFIPN